MKAWKGLLVRRWPFYTFIVLLTFFQDEGGENGMRCWSWNRDFPLPSPLGAVGERIDPSPWTSQRVDAPWLPTLTNLRLLSSETRCTFISFCVTFGVSGKWKRSEKFFFFHFSSGTRSWTSVWLVVIWTSHVSTLTSTLRKRKRETH